MYERIPNTYVKKFAAAKDKALSDLDFEVELRIDAEGLFG